MDEIKELEKFENYFIDGWRNITEYVDRDGLKLVHESDHLGLVNLVSRNEVNADF